MKKAWENLKTIFARMQFVQKTIVGAFLLLTVGLAMYFFLDRPAVKNKRDTEKKLTEGRNANTVRAAQWASLERDAGAPSALTPDLEKRLGDIGNRIFHANEMADIEKMLKALVSEHAGKHVALTQGAETRTKVTLGAEKDTFIAVKVPLRVRFSGTYGGTEEILAQLREMKRFVGVDKVDIRSNGDTAAVRVELTLNLYFKEGT